MSNKNDIINNDIFLMQNEITKLAVETKDISVQILNKLDEQGESIQKSEHNIETSNYLVSKSLRIAKYMTWFGWISNWFTKDPELPKLRKTSTANIVNKEQPVENTKLPSVMQHSNYDNDKMNNAMLEFERNLMELKSVSILIGEQLDKQNECLERISTKENNLSDKIKSTSSYVAKI
jgi:hypothetical protein